MKIVICDPIDEKAKETLEVFCEIEEQLDAEKDLSGADIIIVRSKTTADKALIDSAPNLKGIVRAGVGLDNVDLEYAESKGIKVLNTPTAPSIAVAELTISLIFAMLRHIPRADASTKAGEWLKKELYGHELYKTTVGIVGYGRIGSKVAALANVLEAEVLAFDIKATQERMNETNTRKVEFDELLEKSDIITMHLPLTPETQYLFDEEAFSKMKDGVYIVNTARGPLINEDALYNALSSGKVAGAALDVYWEKTPENSKILEFNDKLVLTPHIGGSTFEAQERIGDLIVEKVREIIEG